MTDPWKWARIEYRWPIHLVESTHKSISQIRKQLPREANWQTQGQSALNRSPEGRGSQASWKPLSAWEEAGHGNQEQRPSKSSPSVWGSALSQRPNLSVLLGSALGSPPHSIWPSFLKAWTPATLTSILRGLGAGQGHWGPGRTSKAETVAWLAHSWGPSQAVPTGNLQNGLDCCSFQGQRTAVSFQLHSLTCGHRLEATRFSCHLHSEQRISWLLCCSKPRIPIPLWAHTPLQCCPCTSLTSALYLWGPA